MFLALPTQGWQFLGAPVQSCMNSAGALGALSESLIFPRVFNVSPDVATSSSVGDQVRHPVLCKTF